MLQGQTAAPGNLSRLCCLQTWMSLTLGLRHSELFSPCRAREAVGDVSIHQEQCDKYAACCDADTGGQHASDAQRPWGVTRLNMGAQDDKTRKHLPERTAQHPSISCTKINRHSRRQPEPSGIRTTSKKHPEPHISCTATPFTYHF